MVDAANATLTAYSYVAIVIFVLTIALVIRPVKIRVHPHIKIYLTIATVPPLSVLILLIIRAIDFDVVGRGFLGTMGVQPWAILILFYSLAYICISLDMTGVFQFCAFWVSKKAGNRGMLAFTLFFILTSVMSGLTSNDVVILTGTVFLSYFTKVSDIIPTAFLMSEFTTANIASMALYIGNPTNVVVSEAYGISFITYSAWMLLPTVVVLLLAYIILRLVFHSEHYLPRHINPPDADPRSVLIDPHGAVFGLVLLACCLLTLVGTSFAHVPVWMVTLPFACVMLIRDIQHDLGLSFHRLFQRIRHRRKHQTYSQQPVLLSMMSRGATVTSTASAPATTTTTTTTTTTATAAAIARRDKREEKGTRDAITSSSSSSSSSSSTASKQHEQEMKLDRLNTNPTITMTPHLLSDDQLDMGTLYLPLSKSKSAGSMGIVRREDTTSTMAWKRKNSQDPPEEADETAIGTTQRRSWFKSYFHPLYRAWKWYRHHLPTLYAVTLRMPWPILPFSLGMFILIEALSDLGWVGIFATAMAVFAKNYATAVLGTVFVSILACQLLNNLPMTILFTQIIQHPNFTQHVQSDATMQGFLLGLIVGSNLGACLTLVGSLAGIMFDHILKTKGIYTLGYFQFLKWNLVILPVLALGASAILIAEIWFMYLR